MKKNIFEKKSEFKCDRILKQAELLNDMKLIVKANALKRRSEETQYDIKKLEKSLDLLESKRKKLE